MLAALNQTIRKTILNEVRKSCCPLRCSRYYSKGLAATEEEKNESPLLKDLLENAALYDDIDSKDENGQWATLPYPALLWKHIEKETGVDPSEVSIILFPGQGTQYIGMGKDLIKFPQARQLYDVASEILGLDLLNISTDVEMNKYSQESIVVSSLGALEKLREERPSAISSCVATAGFSLGEITALIFAGAIPLEQGLRLVSIRSAAMEAASKETPGGMMSIFYTPEANIKKACAEAVEHCERNNVDKAFCGIANYLYPHAKVLSGSHKALKYIEDNAKKLGIRRTKRLNVSGAFHSPGVQSAVAPFREALKMCELSDPQIKVLSGVNGKHYRNAQHILLQLPKQITQAVRWEQLMHNLYSRPKGGHFPRTFEVGPGYTLRTILRQVNAKAWDTSFSISS